MKKLLIIAEKPSVASEIANSLGGFSRVDKWYESESAIVSCGVGHLVEIFSPEAAAFTTDFASLPILPPRFELRAIVKTQAQLSLLARLMKRADVDRIVNACDAGREGELIFRLIYEYAGCYKPTSRMWLQSMTADAIRSSFHSMRPGSEFDALGDAAKCRSEADWLIGINGSRGISKLREVQTSSFVSMSAGRVQTPTLAIIVHHEAKIRSFVPENYWEVHALFQLPSGNYVGKWVRPTGKPIDGSVDADSDEANSINRRIGDKAQADAIVSRCRASAPSSVTDTSKTSAAKPPRLFDLTTLQREANKKFKFSAKKTLDIAQALYEKYKAVSYPRTDANALPEDYIDKVKEILGLFSGTKYAEFAQCVLQNRWVREDKRVFDNSKITDHFAIIPVGAVPAGLDDSETKVYDMLVRRFLAVFYPAAQYSLTTRITSVGQDQFRTTGRVLQASGWLDVYGGDDPGEAPEKRVPALCTLNPGEVSRLDWVVAKALQTTPPVRFTEATLLSAMEGAGKLLDDDALRDAMKERGLGTSATRAAIIEGLLNDTGKGGVKKEPYLIREGKEQYLIPTKKGDGLIEFLDANNIAVLTSPRMTGEWEYKLALMEKGQYQRNAFMREIADTTREIIGVMRQRAADFAPSSNAPVRSPGPDALCPCPKCGAAVVFRGGQYPRYVCVNGDLTIWKNISGRAMSDAEVGRLIKDGALPLMKGFTSATTKRAFSAGLRLSADMAKTEFVFEAR